MNGAFAQHKVLCVAFPSAVTGLQARPTLGPVSGRDGDEAGGFGVRRLSPGVQAVGWAPVVGIWSLSPAVAVRIFFTQRLLYFLAAREASYAVLQEVPAEEHVDPGVTATIQTGQQSRDSSRGVFRICGKEGRKQFNHQKNIRTIQSIASLTVGLISFSITG